MLKKYVPEPQKNHFLAALSPNIQSSLFQHLELVQLPLHAVLYEAHRTMSHVYFPIDSIISVQYLMEDGKSIAISVVGNEGLLGVNLSMGSETSPSRSIVQIAGYAYRLPKRRAKEEFKRHGQLMELMLSYTNCLLAQVAQTAVCNRHHSVYEQLCRWLLMSLDRLEHGHLTMTQEFISNMLGVRRESVTEAANKLRAEGVITYSRGKINVKDPEQLERRACTCYDTVKAETDRLLDYWPKRDLLKRYTAFPVSKTEGMVGMPSIQKIRVRAG